MRPPVGFPNQVDASRYRLFMERLESPRIGGSAMHPPVGFPIRWRYSDTAILQISANPLTLAVAECLLQLVRKLGGRIPLPPVYGEVLISRRWRQMDASAFGFPKQAGAFSYHQFIEQGEYSINQLLAECIRHLVSKLGRGALYRKFIEQRAYHL